jgi:hypothetical protein
MEHSGEGLRTEQSLPAQVSPADADSDHVVTGVAAVSASDMQQQMPMKVAEESIDDPRVAAAIERLDDLDDLPVHEHVAVFTDVQSRLTEALSSVGDGD